MKLNGKDFENLGLKGYCIGESVRIYKKYYIDDPETMKQKIESIIKDPQSYLTDEVFKELAKRLYIPPKVENEYKLLETSVPYKVYGKENIEDAAIEQMNTACQLPVSKYGALMPDGHSGYGLPIGGVLAVKDAIIPFGVGVDIGCMMHLTIFDINPSYLKSYKDKLKKALETETRFGVGSCFETSIKNEHEIIDDSAFNELSLLKGFKQKAHSQLGSSGSGNHFVEFGIYNDDKIALLSHSGSRQLGSLIATAYTKIAIESCKLPSHAKNLAWLDINSEAGQEYWLGMHLAGNYAIANHECIHKRLIKAIGWGKDIIQEIKNHHNFAWKETINDEELIVHRKGATPAYENMMGIIPGSMATKSYVVTGLGNKDALYSSSHGAGRKMSRTKARNSFTMSAMKKDLKAKDIELIGGAIDESTFAYKDIDEVIAIQTKEGLIDIVGSFFPKIVKMSTDKGED